MSGVVREGDDLTNADRGSKDVWHSYMFVREPTVLKWKNFVREILAVQ